MVSEKLEEEITNLWGGKDPEFSAPFSGVSTMKQALFLEKQINISKNSLRQILMKIPTYLMHVQARKKFPRRKYNALGFGLLVEVCVVEI